MRILAGALLARRARVIPAPSLRSLLRALILLLGAGGGIACEDSTCPGAECGTVCHDDDCEADSVCVNNLCRPSCTSDDSCRGKDKCQLIDSDYGVRGRFCYGPELSTNPYLESPEAGSTSTQTASCTRNTDCSTNPAQSCVDGVCLTRCETHEHCGSAGSCTGEANDVAGEAVLFCEPDAYPRGEGQYGSLCLAGRDDCDADSGFRCVGSGEGDADSYCAAVGCATDDACPSGYFCRRQRMRGFFPCEAACGQEGAPSDPDCIAPEDIGPGRAFDCEPGTTGLELRVCTKREFCNSCERNSDCLGLPGQVCARGQDGSKSCTRLCQAGAESCPWGSATDCKVYDTDLAQPTCGHRFGACQGTGNGCEPCVDDRDCPAGFCAVSDFTGEHFCVSLTDTCSCASGEESCLGGGCPMTPDTLEMNCIPRESGAAPSACFGAMTSADTSSGQLGCWRE